MTQNPYDYENRTGIRAISWQDFHGLCKALVMAVSAFAPDIILPIGRAGYYPGTLMAHLLQVELYPVRLSRRVRDVVTRQSPQWLVEPSVDFADQGFGIIHITIWVIQATPAVSLGSR